LPPISARWRAAPATAKRFWRLKGARLLAIGPHTPYARECALLAERLKVADRLEMPGYVDRRRLLERYANCAVVAVPSLYEGVGSAAAQALCAGVPCVVSDRSSLPEVANGDARIVPASEPEAWAMALAEALNGGAQGAAERARTAAIARFSWDASARTVERIYASIDG
jgi:glycosyltransferase involved in cell wall biosynthesis